MHPMKHDLNQRTDPARARHLAWALAAFAILILPMAASAQMVEGIEAQGIEVIGPDVGEPMNPEAEARPFNVLTLDASDGSVVESTDNGASDTTITLVNLHSTEGNYTLRDPEGREAFVAAPPTSEMTVAFLYVPLVESSGLPYTVTHNNGGAKEQILAFVPTDLPSTPVDPTLLPIEGAVGVGTPELGAGDLLGTDLASSSQTASSSACQSGAKTSGTSPGSTNSANTGGSSTSCSSGGGSSQQCWYDRRQGYGETKTRVLGSEVKWTALNVNHAPYGGTSTSTSSWSKMGGFYIFPGGVQSSKETNVKLTLGSGQGGMTQAFYQLARWTQYDRMTCNYNYQWNHGYYLAVSSWTPEGPEVSKTTWIYGSSKYTDGDDTQWVSMASPYSGTVYSSVGINTRYATADKVHSGVATFVVSSSRLFTIGASIQFGGQYFSFDALRGDVTSGSGNYYEYNMPSGTTRADYLQGQSNGWAFCTPSLASC